MSLNQKELEEAMSEMEQFDKIHGQVRRKIGYPKVSL